MAFGTPEHGECVTRRTVVFKADKGTWTQLYEDRDPGWDLFVDVDGDGVPETVTPSSGV